MSAPLGFDLNTAPYPSPPGSTTGANLPTGHLLPQEYRLPGGGGLGSLPHRDSGMTSGSNPAHHESELISGHRPPFPKLEFPKFNGEQPRLWRDQCLWYFEVYDVHPSLKTRFAALNFMGAAALWLQTIERRGRISDWDQLC